MPSLLIANTIDARYDHMVCQRVGHTQHWGHGPIGIGQITVFFHVHPIRGNAYDALPQAQKAVAQYIMDHYQSIPFLSVTAMAREIGVSDTTIIKYCVQLGFSGFGEFKRKVTDYVQNQANWSNQFQANLHQIQTKDAYFTVYQAELSNLQDTITNSVNRKSYDTLLSLIWEAENIYIAGMRSSSIPAQFMALGLGQQGYRTFPITPGTGDIYDIICRMTPKDLFISFCFSRYAQLTVEAAKFATQNQVPHIAFSDSLLSPTAIRATATFLCSTRSYGNTPSLIGAVALINTILAGCAQRHPEQAKQRMHLIEEFAGRSGLYHMMETDEQE